MSWTELGLEGDPVRGDLDAFERAARDWFDARGHAQAVRSTFSGIVSGCESVGLEGKARDAFEKIVEDVQSVLDDVPEVFRQLHDVLHRHAQRLRELRVAADAALARGKLAQAQRKTASSQQAATNARIASLQSQITQLRALPPDQAAAAVASLERQLAGEVRTRTTRSHELTDLVARVQAEKDTWRSLRNQEDALNLYTATRLDAIDLKSLRDPSWLEQQAKKVGDFFGELWDDFLDIGAALLQGQWADALYHLHDFVDGLLTVLAVIGLAMTVVAAVALVAFGTVISFGLLAPVLAAIGLALATYKLASSLTLVTMTDAKHPETGERMGWAQVGWDAVGVITAAVGLKGAMSAYKPGAPVHQGGLARYNAKRALLREKTGISFYSNQTGRNRISVPLSSQRGAVQAGSFLAGDHDFETALELGGFESPNDWLDSRTKGGESSVTPGEAAIEADIAAIRSGERGLTAPVQTCLVPTF